MLNIHATSLFSTWVKNVYSLCVEGVVNRAQSYTDTYKSTFTPNLTRVQPTTFTQLVDSFAPFVYTANFRYFNLLNAHLYTVSTAPTIKKNKKK